MRKPRNVWANWLTGATSEEFQGGGRYTSCMVHFSSSSQANVVAVRRLCPEWRVSMPGQWRGVGVCDARVEVISFWSRLSQVGAWYLD